MAAVERQQRQQVEQREREADQAEHAEVVARALLERLRRAADDADRARDVLAALAVDEVGRARAPISFVTSPVTLERLSRRACGAAVALGRASARRRGRERDAPAVALRRSASADGPSTAPIGRGICCRRRPRVPSIATIRSPGAQTGVLGGVAGQHRATTRVAFWPCGWSAKPSR